MASLKGKSTRRKPPPVQTQDIIAISKELKKAQKNVTLCVDLMFVNGVGFLTSICTNIKFQAAIYIPDREPATLMEALDKVLSLYNNGGFTIKTIQADPKFVSILEPLHREHSIKLDLVPTKAHVPEAEWNNRTLKEQIRAMYHVQPWQWLPKQLVIAMV